MRSRRLATAATALCLTLPFLSGAAGTHFRSLQTAPRSVGPVETSPTQIDIDCDAGDSLADLPLSSAPFPGLASFAEPDGDDDDDDDDDYLRDAVAPIVINITGTCDAGIVIRRDNVTLRGQSVDSTILRGTVDAGGNQAGAVVEARNVNNLVIEDMTIEGGVFGVLSFGSTVSVDRVLVRDNSFGVYSRTGGLLTVNDSEVRANRFGVLVQQGASLALRGSKVADNTVIGVGTVGRTSVVDSEIRGGVPVVVALGGRLDFSGSSSLATTGSSVGVVVGAGALIQVSNGQLDAWSVPIRLVDGASWIVSQFATLNLGGTPMRVEDASILTVSGTFNGGASIENLSRGVIRGTMTGFLNCAGPSDAVCSGSVNGSNCSGCPGGAGVDPGAGATAESDGSDVRPRDLLILLERLSAGPLSQVDFLLRGGNSTGPIGLR